MINIHSKSPATVGKIVKIETEQKEETRIGSFDYAVAINRWSMKFLGLWPLNDTCFSSLKCSVCFIVTGVLVFPTVLRLLTLTDWVTITNQANVTLPYLPLLPRYILMKRQAGNLRAILRKMTIDWANYRYMSKRNQQSMIQYAKKGRQVNIISIVWITMSCMVYLLTPVAHTWRNDLWNATRRLPTEGFYPTFFYQSPAFETLYIAQGIIGCISGMIIFSVDCFLCNVVYHACGQLDVLAATLERYDDTVEHDCIENAHSRTCACLSCIVKRHVYIIRYMNAVERCFSGLIFIQLSTLTIIVAFLGFGIITYIGDSNLNDTIIIIIYEVTFTYGIFIYCHVGECILERSENIGKVAYNLEWNRFQRNFALSIILLIIRSRKPCRITAKGFATMCLSYYKTILMASISYISFLRATSVVK